MENSAQKILENISISAERYKCFGSEGPKIEKILPLNIIIGRNNSGKSSVLDLVQFAIEPNPSKKLQTSFSSLGEQYKLIVSFVANEENVRIAVQNNVSVMNGVGLQFIGKKVIWKTGGEVSIEPDFSNSDATLSNGKIKDMVATQKVNLIRQYKFRRLLADRDIRAEIYNNASPYKISEDGVGATALIHKFESHSEMNDNYLSVMCESLNEIFNPDLKFKKIKTKESNQWEVFLEDVFTGRNIPLSQMGSGLKTVLLVLCLIHLQPVVDNASIEDYIFGLEELENNLHPAAQRKLFNYLRNVAMEKGCVFFITTHSNVVIDLFSKDNQAQIIHVTHDGQKATAKTVTTYVDHKGILDDLDVRASDLLQANSVIWVEGPSDRMYFNHWINLWSKGKLTEGIHYQCVCYGGKVLSHLSLEPLDEKLNDLIPALRLNRNAIVLMDRDRNNGKEDIGATKKRVCEEAKNVNAISWITEGREIENYLTPRTLAEFYNCECNNVEFSPYEDVLPLLDGIFSATNKKYAEKKVLFAEDIIPHISEADLDRLDLREQLENIGKKLFEWNGIKPI